MLYKKRLVCLIILVVSFLFGTSKNLYGWDITEAAKSYYGRTIKISLMAGYEVNKVLLNKVIPSFEKMTGIKVEVDFVPYQDVIPTHDRILEADASEYDLVNVDDVWFPHYVHNLYSIEPFINNARLAMPSLKLDDFIPELLMGYQWEEKNYCFPITFEFPILMVRKDLFKEAGLVDEKGEIIPPKSFDEYYKYAKLLTKDTDNDGKTDIYGTTLHGYKTGIFDEVVSWYWGAGGELFGDNLKVDFNNPIMVKALDTYQKIYVNGYAPPESSGWELGEAATAFRTGKTAMSWNWTMVGAWILDPKQSYVYDKVDFIPLFKEDPNRVRYLREASNALCIPKKARNKEAAFLFMQWYTSPQMEKEYISDSYLVHPSRKSVIFSKEYADKVPYAGIQRAVINKHAIRLCPKITDYPNVDQVSAMYFQQVMTGNMSAEDGVAAAAKGVENLLRTRNYYEKPNKKYSQFLSGRYR